MVEDIDELAGLAQTNLGMAIVLAILMFSLAGIPPLAGFFAKFYVFLAAVKEGSGRSPSSACSPAWSAPTTTCASSRSCSSTSRRSASWMCRPRSALIMAVSGLFVLLYVVWPAPLVDCGRTRRAQAALF